MLLGGPEYNSPDISPKKNYNSPIRLEITVLLTSNCYINNGGLIDFLRYLASCKTQPGSSIVYKINNLK